MFDEIIAWDRELFCRLGVDHTPFLDSLMTAYTELWTWIPAFALLLWVVWRRVGGREMLFVAGGLLLTVLIADQMSSSLIKPLAERLRPSHEAMMAGCVRLVNGYAGGLYGFVSSHAANAVGVAVFTALLFRSLPYSLAIALWALADCYTRIYLGVHYPLDLLGGAAVGAAAAWGCWRLYVFSRKKRGLVIRACFRPSDAWVVIGSIGLTVVSIMAVYFLIIAFSAVPSS